MAIQMNHAPESRLTAMPANSRGPRTCTRSLQPSTGWPGASEIAGVFFETSISASVPSGAVVSCASVCRSPPGTPTPTADGMAATRSKRTLRPLIAPVAPSSMRTRAGRAVAAARVVRDELPRLVALRRDPDPDDAVRAAARCTSAPLAMARKSVGAMMSVEQHLARCVGDRDGRRGRRRPRAGTSRGRRCCRSRRRGCAARRRRGRTRPGGSDSRRT